MADTLLKGANAVLAQTGAVRIVLRWDATRIEPNIACFALDDTVKVPDDAWFLFYHRTEAPGGVLRLIQDHPGQAEIQVQLDRLPAEIRRCVITATLTAGRFRDANGATLTAIADSPPRELVFTLTDAEDEQALIFGEIYRHAMGWKLRAVGQGFRGGLPALAEHFGVAVSATDTPPPAPPPPAPDQSTPPPRPAPRAEPSAPLRGPRRRFALRPLLRRLLGVLVGGVLALGSFALAVSPPAWLKRWFAAAIPQVSVLPSRAIVCALPEEEVWRRYRELGENYVHIIEQVRTGNQRLFELRRSLAAGGLPPPDCLADNQAASAQLEQLAVRHWLEECDILNACAGKLIKRLEQELGQETRPIVIQRLIAEADRARNLESDLTNIARDLAYLDNKKHRLIAGYQENLDACRR